MSGWQEDQAWAVRHESEVRRIIAGLQIGMICEIRVAESVEDQHAATDFIVTVTSGDIGCRLRRYPCSFRDFTLRSWRRSGTKTELAKVKEGWPRWYLYGWENVEGLITDWIFVDMDGFRQAKLWLQGAGLDRDTRLNPDGLTGFIAVFIGDLDTAGCLIASGDLPKS